MHHQHHYLTANYRVERKSVCFLDAKTNLKKNSFPSATKTYFHQINRRANSFITFSKFFVPFISHSRCGRHHLCNAMFGVANILFEFCNAIHWQKAVLHIARSLMQGNYFILFSHFFFHFSCSLLILFLFVSFAHFLRLSKMNFHACERNEKWIYFLDWNAKRNARENFEHFF